MKTTCYNVKSFSIFYKYIDMHKLMNSFVNNDIGKELTKFETKVLYLLINNNIKLTHYDVWLKFTIEVYILPRIKFDNLNLNFLIELIVNKNIKIQMIDTIVKKYCNGYIATLCGLLHDLLDDVPNKDYIKMVKQYFKVTMITHNHKLF